MRCYKKGQPIFLVVSIGGGFNEFFYFHHKKLGQMIQYFNMDVFFPPTHY